MDGAGTARRRVAVIIGKRGLQLGRNSLTMNETKLDLFLHKISSIVKQILEWALYRPLMT